MQEEFQRTALLLGEAAIHKLQSCRVAVFGLGGVGGYVIEALARTGVGALDLIDFDKITKSNLNRQILATRDSLGRFKTEVAKERILSINPLCRVTEHVLFYLPDSKGNLDFNSFDYVVDAIDNVSGKLSIIEEASKSHVPVISCMGTGNKLDPSRFEVADIYDTSVCPLARVMRRECRSRNITHLKVVFSREEPRIPADSSRVPGSVSFVPSSAGLLLAGEVIKDLIRE